MTGRFIAGDMVRVGVWQYSAWLTLLLLLVSRLNPD